MALIEQFPNPPYSGGRCVLGYDPERQPSLEDPGCLCPRCNADLIWTQVEPKPGREGSLIWDCPFCGCLLRENKYQYLFVRQSHE